MTRVAMPAVAAIVLALAGAPAIAQAPGRAAGTDVVPALGGEAARLRPGEHVYDVIVTSDSGTMLVGTHRVGVQEGSFAGDVAWMIVDQRESLEPFVRVVAADTVLLGRESLRPRRWSAHTGDARFVAAFTNDSVYGGATSPLARRTFTLGADGMLLTSEGALDALLGTVDMPPGWSAQATMLVADLGGGRLVPITLTLAYETTLQLAAGRFDVRVVHVDAGGTHRWIWIDKATGVVVRTETLSPHMPGMLVERILTHPPRP